MGKLMIKGEAKRRVEADIETITIRFQSREGTSANAAERVISDSEEFLEIIKELGVDLSSIQLANDGIDQDSYNDDIEVTATRELMIEIGYDIRFNNDILDIIQKNNMNVDLEVVHDISNRSALHEELIQEAVADSRKKAELIASATGQKIIGIDEVHLGERYVESRMDWMCQEKERSIARPRAAMLSDQLKAPVVTESETVNVTWIIE